MQHDSQPDLIPAWQDGSLSAARQIVSMYQAEAINVAYLLTGERDDAIALAETGFVRLFETTAKGDPDVDPRQLLLNIIGQAWLRDDFRERVKPDAGGLLIEPAPARFQVDDRRTLLLAALGRLDKRERAILVLRDFSGLETSEMTRLQERRGEPLVAPMETARQRVRQSVDIPAGDPLRPAFVEATFRAPKAEIWARIEDDVAAIQTRSRNQSRTISIAIVAVVAVVLIGGMLVLFSGDGSGGPDSVGNQPTAEPTSLPAGPTVAQSIDMEPTATPTVAGISQGNVPSWLLLETTHQRMDNATYRSISVFDPATGGTRRIPSNDPIRIAPGADNPHISPDGYQMVFFREEFHDESMHYYLTSYSTGNIARQWDTEILTLQETPERQLRSPSHIPVRLATALTGNRVYAAFLTTDHEPRLEVHAFFSRNGMPRGSAEIDLPLQTPDTRVFNGNILLHAPPDSDRLYLLMESFGDSVEEWRAALMTFDRNDLTLLSERSISADPNQGYWLWNSSMVVDGSALYAVQEPRDGSMARVQFLELDTGEITSLPLPFTSAPNRLESVLSIPSHDGRSLYVLDRTGTSVAVVDLREREIERVFPMARGASIADFGVSPDSQIFGLGATITADGSRLFVASWDHGDDVDDSAQRGIWVIDTSIWEITGFVPAGGLVDGIFLSPNENAIHAQVWVNPYGSTHRELVKIVNDSQPTVVERMDLPDNGADFTEIRSPAFQYRSQFGHSPAIDNIPLQDLATYSTLPGLEVVTGQDVISVGQNATIEVHVIDPSTGEPYTGGKRDVRFDPGTAITATLWREGQPSQLVVLGERERGIYSGTVNLPSSGEWSVDASLTGSLGTTATREKIGTVDVTPALVGSDGRRYRFRISTIPDIPYSREETVIQLELLDMDTDEPVPEDVSIQIVDGAQPPDEEFLLPDRIDVRLTPSASGLLTARLSKVEHGVYQGTVSFWSSGPWEATIEFEPEGGVEVALPARPVMVSGT